MNTLSVLKSKCLLLSPYKHTQVYPSLFIAIVRMALSRLGSTLSEKAPKPVENQDLI